jgi:hypothetical protein
VFKVNGSSKPIDIQVTLVDGNGNPLTGATIAATAQGIPGETWSGNLVDIGGGQYQVCSVGSFAGNNGGHLLVTITVTKAGYAPVTTSTSEQVGDVC